MRLDMVTLTCWTCGDPWEHPRRRGQYPIACPSCVTTEHTARLIAQQARLRGLHTARAVRHERQGWVCVVATIWHPEPVILRDTHDIGYLLAELGLDRRAGPPTHWLRAGDNLRHRSPDPAPASTAKSSSASRTSTTRGNLLSGWVGDEAA